MTTIVDVARTAADHPLDEAPDDLVGGPVNAGWREGTLTRAKELEALSRWICRNGLPERVPGDCRNPQDLMRAVEVHIAAARDAAHNRPRFQMPHKAARMERARSNLDAAEAHLMQLAPPDYLLGQLPSVLNHVQRHLPAFDPRRKHFECIAARVGVADPPDPHQPVTELTLDQKRDEVEQEREKIVSAMRAASSAALREQVRLHSFRNVVVATTAFLTLLAGGFAVIGFLSPTMIPLCFEPEAGAEVLVVCPTGQSVVGPVSPGSSPSVVDIDDVVSKTATELDLLAVEAVGLAAAAIAAAAAIRGIRGSSERYGLPVALALLKLPTGAMTAVLGLLLMRGQFIPGLSALDSSAQILAWALVFGYAQQLFTRMIDQQAHTVLDDIRNPKKSANPH